MGMFQHERCLCIRVHSYLQGQYNHRYQTTRASIRPVSPTLDSCCLETPPVTHPTAHQYHPNSFGTPIPSPNIPALRHQDPFHHRFSVQKPRMCRWLKQRLPDFNDGGGFLFLQVSIPRKRGVVWWCPCFGIERTRRCFPTRDVGHCRETENVRVRSLSSESVKGTSARNQ